MLKRILVVLSASEFTPAAVRMAAEMADVETEVEHERVTLVGLSVVDTDLMPSGRFSSLVPREELLAEAQAKAEKVITEFRALTKTLGVRENLIETSCVSGSPFREVIRKGVFCDLIVLGRKSSFPPVYHDYETMPTLFHRASRPVLIVGDTHRPLERVILAMDGTAPSSRVMYHYVHLNPFPKAKLQVIYSKGEEEQYHLTEYFRNVESYLKSFHLDVEMKRLDGEVRNEIVEVVKKEDAQVIAMGIHSENFLDRFGEALHINLREDTIEKILRTTSACLFTVH
ncbi:MAG: universal stress protein [SAR324 cluster bacterium]|nr:universal stress protein [SAR324 cluster bacterium]